MNIAALIHDAQSEGLELSLSTYGKIELTGSRAIREKWARLLKPYRGEVVTLLSGADVFDREAFEEFDVPVWGGGDDRRTCYQCTNLIDRRCTAAKRGEILASRNYEPIRDLLRRCEGYSPGADDPDRRHGRERWPGL
jgi:hypothetical protein